MNPRHLRELLTSGHRQTLEFFFLGLKDVLEADVDEQELLYNASVLAHFAQVSAQSPFDAPVPVNLTAVFDQYVLDASMWKDGTLMETAGAQCLLLAGFFEDQMRRRHNIRWYAELGAGFFRRAALQAPTPIKGQLLHTLARNFEPWRQRHARLSRDLRDRPFLMRPRPPITSS